VYDKNWKKLIGGNIDERNFNVLQIDYTNSSDKRSKLVKDWLISQFNNMKLSNKQYGTYGIGKSKKEGKECLYAHDFMLWLEDHQNFIAQEFWNLNK